MELPITKSRQGAACSGGFSLGSVRLRRNYPLLEAPERRPQAGEECQEDQLREPGTGVGDHGH